MHISTKRNHLLDSLAFKLGFRIILVELVILTGIGILYLNRFDSEIDQRIEHSVELPAQLLQRGWIQIASLSNDEAMQEIVDAGIQEIILTDEAGQVIFSNNSDYMRMPIGEISFVDASLFTLANPPTFTARDSTNNGQYIYNVSRIELINGITRYLYVRINTDAAEAQKQNILLLFFGGSLATFMATIVGIFYFLRRTIFQRLGHTSSVLKTVEKGDLSTRVSRITGHDEISDLQSGVNTMIQQLQNNFATLELRVKERTKEAEDARQQAEEANQAKSLFLSNMSHELRTPLNTVIGYTSTMLDRPQMYDNQTLPDIFRPDVRLIQENGQYLLGLINDILDLSKIEAGKLTLSFEPFDLQETFKGVIATSTGLLKGKPLQLSSEYPDEMPLVHADPMRVRQILLNLMSNGVKFTESGTVKIKAEVVEDGVQIAVVDTGIGIPKEAIATIFDRFEQVKTGGPEHIRGTGLGLDISMQLCRMHGSELTIESEVQKGTTFRFTLPVATAEEIETTTLSSLSDYSAEDFDGEMDDIFAASILLVEDSADTRTLLRRLLESEGYMVFEATDGETAVPIANGILPDLIVLDVRLPGISGWDVIQTLKNNPETTNIPVVILTIDSDEQRAYEAGATLYVKKPVRTSHFVSQIGDLLKNNSVESTQSPKKKEV